MPDLDQMRDDALGHIAAAADLPALDAVRVAALGKQGTISLLLKTLGAMSPEQRQVEGPRLNALRETVSAAIAARKAALETAALDARLAAERIDLTLPADLAAPGTVHPVSQVMDELAEIFADLGFAVATGPEIEDDWHNFTALNIPETHPARAMHDTFYVERTARPSGGAPASPSDGGFAAGAPDPVAHAGQSRSSNGEGGSPPAALSALRLPAALGASRMVLRTHTSPVQIRHMKAVAARTGGAGEPVRIIAPGRVYRSDWDATHTPMFHQVEGLVIDRGITLGHLKWTLETFLKAFFERDDIVLRLRPSYFPFTEPSAEVDVGFRLDKGRRVLGGSDGWMELLGSGMVHRRVIAAAGLDPDVWQGFAFGVGVDRLAMLKYGADDLRPFFEGDSRWLAHHGFSALDVPTISGGVGA